MKGIITVSSAMRNPMVRRYVYTYDGVEFNPEDLTSVFNSVCASLNRLGEDLHRDDGGAYVVDFNEADALYLLNVKNMYKDKSGRFMKHFDESEYIYEVKDNHVEMTSKSTLTTYPCKIAVAVSFLREDEKDKDKVEDKKKRIIREDELRRRIMEAADTKPYSFEPEKDPWSKPDYPVY